MAIRSLPLLLILLLQPGCYMLEVPLANRSSYPALAGGGGSAGALQPGVTTRAQVLQQFGNPVFRYDGETIWEYVEHPDASFYLIVPPVVAHGPLWGTTQGTHYLFLRFDTGGTLRDYEVLLHPDQAEHEAEIARFRATPDASIAPALQFGQRMTFGPPAASPSADVGREKG
ncbi:MAG TPA: hypothetical protein VH475_12900 [Tepidisphaeraceae bacterium]